MFGNRVKDIIRNLHVSYLRKRGESCMRLQIEECNNVVVVAPHPDDEAIGCSGLIARLVADGRAPHIIVMTGGEGSHNGCCSTDRDEIIAARRKLTRNALSVLGVPESHIHELDYPDGEIDFRNEQTDRLKKMIQELRPDTIFVPHWGEGWPDHVRAAEIVRAVKPVGAEVWEYCVWMWYYNVWRGLDWKNAAVLNLTSAEHNLKLKAIDAYITPLAPCGNPWSGVLPRVFVEANRWNKELYFKKR
ncbi:MAG: PIG-L family deacetylase [Muribaculaceae bacterium]|nr:PIG-L family deacetylase [Muribaculaceae bacterium]